MLLLTQNLFTMNRQKKRLLLLVVFFALSYSIEDKENERNSVTIIGENFNIEENILAFKSSDDLKLHVVGSISFPGLYNYKDADIDIVGVSRKGNTWRGSKLVFKK